MVAAVLRKARTAFAKRMRATCRIERPTGPVDDGQGGVIVTYERLYEGGCYVRYPGMAFESNLDAAGVTVVQSRVVVRVPFGIQYLPGDLVRMTADPDNPQLVGTVYRVASLDDQSQASAQRLLCEDNQAGVT